MSKTLELELITPEKAIMKTAATFVVLPAVGGEMGKEMAILPGHAPFLVQLQPGSVRVTAQNGEVSLLAVSGGFAEVQGTRVSLFAETAEMAESIDSERARQALEKAKADATRKDLDPLTLMQAEAAVRRAQVRLKVSMIRRTGKGPNPTSGGGH